MAKITVQDTQITLLQWEEQMNICIKTIIVLASIVINNLSVFAQTKDFEHHALLAGDSLK